MWTIESERRQRDKTGRNEVPGEQIVHDRLHHLLETLEEPEQEAVVSSIQKLLDAFEKGMWRPVRR
jgi:hypothetical protein